MLKGGAEQMAGGAEGVLPRLGELEQCARERRQQELLIAAHSTVDLGGGALSVAAGHGQECERELARIGRLKLLCGFCTGQCEKRQPLVEVVHRSIQLCAEGVPVDEDAAGFGVLLQHGDDALVQVGTENAVALVCKFVDKLAGLGAVKDRFGSAVEQQEVVHSEPPFQEGHKNMFLRYFKRNAAKAQDLKMN